LDEEKIRKYVKPESGVNRAGGRQKAQENDGFVGVALQQSIAFGAERLSRPVV
jgi:hypothetical protein